MKVEKIDITIDKKGFERYCNQLKESAEGRKVLEDFVKMGVLKVVK